LDAAVVPGLGFLSSLSGAPTIASLSETHAVLNEAAEISRMSIECQRRWKNRPQGGANVCHSGILN